MTPRLSLLRSDDRPRPGHATLDAKLASATREVLVARTASAASPRQLAAFRKVDHDNLRRGVRYRVLVPDTARTAPVLSAELSALAMAGADIRTMPEVPVDALVIDRALTVVPADRAEGVAMFQLASVVTTITELFDRVWLTAVPYTASTLPCGAEVTPRERELLTLLFAGSTDEAAATRLNVSVRTVRRMVSDLMDRLGARSRFQAGAKAADRGWLMERAS